VHGRRGVPDVRDAVVHDRRKLDQAVEAAAPDDPERRV
jgi:hypothetical protein